jgi:hypothetical protein
LYLKELRYNEIYFSSAAESNDPYDGKVFLSYKFDKDRWKRILESAWKAIPDSDTLSTLTIPLSEHLEKNCPITFEETISYDYKGVLLAINPNLSHSEAYYLDLLIKQFVDIYRPCEEYTVSFSKTNSNTLMWSHYASKHKGYCLIFKDIDGCLYQDKEHQKKFINRKTPRGAIAPLSGSGIPEFFHFQDITYCPNIEMIDASRFMPRHVFRRNITDTEERIKFLNENDKKCLEKHECWQYENESRLLLDEPPAWLFGEHFEYSQEERLLHYQPTQLVGIILGALMEPKIKKRIREIISDLRERIARTIIVGPLFDFVLFEASISDKHRDVEITPKEIHGLPEVTTKEDSLFTSMLKNWEDGWAIVYDKNVSFKKQFI